MAESREDPRKLFLREKLSCRAELGERVFSFDVRIAALDARGIVITIPDLGGEELLPGQEILVRYFREDSAYQFLTKVLSHEAIKGKPHPRLAFPARITRYQRREHPRAELGGVVRFRATPSNGETLRGLVKDISGGGLLFSSPRVPLLEVGVSPVGKMLYLDLTLENGEELYGLSGEIRRVSADPNRTTHVEVQVRFVEINRRQRERLEQIARRWME